jgi:hypothetical protein
MFIVIVAALLGIWRYRSVEYFKWVAILFAWMLAGTLLFAGGGTLEDPSGDGLIARQIRQATNDGPGMGAFALIFIVVYWGGAILFISRMVREARAITAGQTGSYDDADLSGADEVDQSRKVLETLGLLAAAAIWIWFAFLRPTEMEVAEEAPALQNKEPAKPVALTVEQQVLGAAAEVNSDVPKRLDAQTVLLKATAAGRTLTYHYAIDPRGAGPDEFPSFARRRIIPRVCTGPLRASMKDPGVTYIFSYQSDKWDKTVSTTIDESVCSALEG